MTTTEQAQAEGSGQGAEPMPGLDSGLQTPTVSAAIGEVAIAQVAETSRRMVEAKFLMAERHPRVEDDARAKILRDCKRPGFAKRARYHKPVGTGIEGLSIRFAEAAVRHWTNVLVMTPVLYEDEDRRITRVEVIDLETNITYSYDMTIEKTVERRTLKDGQPCIGERINSSGKLVYLVRATEDEMLGKTLNIASKVIRNGVLRMLPVDLKEEAEAAILDTIRSRAEKDPDAMKKEVLDDFARLDITPSDLRGLGFDLDHLSANDLNELSEIITELEDGRATWKDVCAARTQEPEESRSQKAKGAASKAAAAAKGKGDGDQQEMPS